MVSTSLEKPVPVLRRPKIVQDKRKFPIKDAVSSTIERPNSVQSRPTTIQNKNDSSQILNKARDAEISHDEGDYQNTTADDKKEEAKFESSFISMLEEKVKALRTKLEAKDEVIERQRIENKKVHCIPVAVLAGDQKILLHPCSRLKRCLLDSRYQI